MASIHDFDELKNMEDLYQFGPDFGLIRLHILNSEAQWSSLTPSAFSAQMKS